jgi:hypothetical protein
MRLLRLAQCFTVRDPHGYRRRVQKLGYPAGRHGSALIWNVEHVDTVFDRAITAGATVGREVHDEFYGDRAGQFVELLGRYSNWTSWTDRLPATDKTGELRRESQSRARRTARRLSEGDVAELVTRYQQGATVYDLAERFTIHRTTVSGHLHRRGVRLRGLSSTLVPAGQHGRPALVERCCHAAAQCGSA